jgi:hypothetical protein
MVKASVLKILKNGLLVSFFGGKYAGRISRQHVDFPIQKLSENFDIGNEITARIIYINYDNKEVGLSVKSHIIYYSSLQFPSLKAGDMLSDARAKKPAGTKLRREYYLELSGDNPQPVFLPYGAHPSKDWKPKYKDDVVPCCITGVDIFSGIVRANANSGVIANVTEKDYTSGDIIASTVTKVEAHQVKVLLSGKTSGLYSFLMVYLTYLVVLRFISMNLKLLEVRSSLLEKEWNVESSMSPRIESRLLLSLPWSARSFLFWMITKPLLLMQEQLDSFRRSIRMSTLFNSIKKSRDDYQRTKSKESLKSVLLLIAKLYRVKMKISCWLLPNKR